jgi:two-component system response regulator CpxR
VPGRGRRVLVVEDERDVRDVLVDVLKGEGYLVSFACDGQDALRQVFLRWPEVILLDLMIPIMSGWQFLRVLSENRMLRTIPVIVVSAFECDTDVAAVIPKPFEVEAVLESVHRLAS